MPDDPETTPKVDTPPTAPEPSFNIEHAVTRLQEQMSNVLEMLTNDRAGRATSTERPTEPAEPTTGSGNTPATEEAGPAPEADRRPNNAHWFFKKRGGK